MSQWLQVWRESGVPGGSQWGAAEPPLFTSHLTPTQQSWHGMVTFITGAEEAAVPLGSVLICALREPSFSLVESGEQRQSLCRAARSCCPEGGTTNREPTICLTRQIHQHQKAFFKNGVFRGSGSVYIHNAGLYAGRLASCQLPTVQPPSLSWHKSLQLHCLRWTGASLHLLRSCCVMGNPFCYPPSFFFIGKHGNVILGSSQDPFIGRASSSPLIFFLLFRLLLFLPNLR